MLFGRSRLDRRSRLFALAAMATVSTSSLIGVSALGASKIQNSSPEVGAPAGTIEIAGGRTLVPKRVRLIIDFKQTVTV